MCNWTREGNLPPPPPSPPVGRGIRPLTGPPTHKSTNRKMGQGEPHAHTRAVSPKRKMLACPGERAALMIWSVRQC